MEILILGAGDVGRLIAFDLSKDYEVFIGDINEKRLKLAEEFGTTLQLDASKLDQLVETMRRFDFVIGALPGRLGFTTLKAAIKAKKDMVDVSFMPEDPLRLDEDAKKVGVSIAVDAGFAPGLSNILMGRIASQLGKLDKGVINVGGLPKNPKPPLYYKVVFSPYDLIEEYTRPARIIKGGRLVTVDPLEEIKEVKIGNFEFESFINDGLRTLLTTIEADNLYENTLRWKGHLEKIKVLKELGFFRKENLDFTMKVILPLMKFESEDFSIMEVYGRSGDQEIKYFMYDEAREGFSSMARSTGYITAITARIMLKYEFEAGIIPPELFGMEEELFKYIVKEVRKRNITLEEYHKGL
ncbi:saccharopine dehydrogenase NADP-binding domain-containing protein [Thermococcus argininiproducens]|uniref:Saccharopine dehydrogenase NADP-binding domain-containing protein n=1 Tax=Thermococcus argininiproducens TaxID=2866384 RepID=A0A9E7M950_9EURY|nr:saccharopine dehydrogenase C-terminal domain-containing protein [Thermococcus argininiproducens]USG99375.1 saccharopine dehydrogenase NADP-binding domain-containing protein [Thermococcus argininiproducens]